MERKKKKAQTLKKKLNNLIALLEPMRSVLVAFSGGLDSSLLSYIAKQALGNKVLAVTAVSSIFPQQELIFARRITKRLRIRHKIIKSAQLNNPVFINNPVNRCYYCKKELFGRLWDVAGRLEIDFVLDGSNASDFNDFRPGNQAKREFNVRSPLAECLLNKRDIYQLSKMFRLPTVDKPAGVCLASRIPYGQPIQLADLNMIDRAEEYIRKLGCRQVRVRHYRLGVQEECCLHLARIEVDLKDISRLAAGGSRNLIMRYLKRLGYDYISLDLEGYRTGSLNRF